MIEFLPFFLIAVILFLFMMKSKNKKSDINTEQLDKEIQAKQTQLAQLTQHIQERELDRSTNLTETQIEVLDIYERSHIRLPQDIIEDVAYSRIYEYQEIIAFIENQRNYWKLENTKKPYKKKVTRSVQDAINMLKATYNRFSKSCIVALVSFVRLNR